MVIEYVFVSSLIFVFAETLRSLIGLVAISEKVHSLGKEGEVLAERCRPCLSLRRIMWTNPEYFIYGDNIANE